MRCFSLLLVLLLIVARVSANIDDWDWGRGGLYGDDEDSSEENDWLEENDSSEEDGSNVSVQNLLDKMSQRDIF